MPLINTCPDCGTPIGQPHKPSCDVERCSVCGTQRISCGCDGHEPAKSVWTGEWPGLTMTPKHVDLPAKAKWDSLLGLQSTLGPRGELIYWSPTGCPLAIIEPSEDDNPAIGLPVSLMREWIEANVK